MAIGKVTHKRMNPHQIILIILQKDEHCHAYIHSFWNVTPGKETRKTNECTHINSDGIILQKEGHSNALI